MTRSQDRSSWEMALPFASPLGSPGEDASAQVGPTSGRSTGTNTPSARQPQVVASRQRGRVGRRQLARLAEELSDRDREVLRRVAEHHYLTTLQLQAFVFTDHASAASAARTCRRVLARLHRAGLLRPLPRRVGGVRAGSGATVWQLAPAGARLLRDETGYRTHEPSPRFLAHCLAVADVHLTLRGLAMEDQAVAQTVTVDVEPTSWRRYTGSGGEARWLQPDLHAVLVGHDRSGEFEDRWFCEIDLGTESLPTLVKKCRQYEAYRASGIEQEDHGVFPLVLWIFHGSKAATRAAQLRSRIARDSWLSPALYRYATADTLRDVVMGAGS